MDKERTVKNIVESKPEGSSRMGIPNLIRLEDVEKDLQEMVTEGS
jgi:hypothetical protein